MELAISRLYFLKNSYIVAIVSGVYICFWSVRKIKGKADLWANPVWVPVNGSLP